MTAARPDAQAQRRRLPLPRPEGRPGAGQGGAGPDPVAGHPAGLDRRLDLPRRNGHIQATGRDAKGRKQYRYHPRFREVRDERPSTSTSWPSPTRCPRSARRSTPTWRSRGLPREKVLATVVRLLETTLIRVGNDEYARSNKQLRPDHPARPRMSTSRAPTLRFQLQGQERQDTGRCRVTDRRVATDRQGLPGPAGPAPVPVSRRRTAAPATSARRDVNAYLARDHRRGHHRQGFPHLGRHGAGGAGAAGVRELRQRAAGQDATSARAIESVAARLGNTPTICRKCYIHPQVLNCYMEGGLLLQVKDAVESRAERDLSSSGPRRRPFSGCSRRGSPQRGRRPGSGGGSGRPGRGGRGTRGAGEKARTRRRPSRRKRHPIRVAIGRQGKAKRAARTDSGVGAA